jgi:hypothetical protein
MLVAACAEELGPTYAPDEDEDSLLHPPTAEPVQEDGDAKGAYPRFANDNERDPDLDVCELLPVGDGACAHACDPVALATFIPAGTCVTFTCTLTDGSPYRTGGCNPVE